MKPMSFIKTIPPEEATDRLKRVYDAAVKRAGSVAKVLEVQSLNPKVLQASIQLYQAIMHDDSSLSRAEREMIAVVVSVENECFY